MTAKKRVAQSRFPKGWDESRIRAVISHYENQTEEEAIAEDDAMFGSGAQTMMGVPTELVGEVRAMIAKHEQRSPRSSSTKTGPARRGRSGRPRVMEESKDLRDLRAGRKANTGHKGLTVAAYRRKYKV